MKPKVANPFQISAPAQVEEYYNHPSEGYIPFDPNTRQFYRTKHLHPVYLPPGFAEKQPNISTCSEPGPGNFGCAKWAGCPFKSYPHVGPGNMIISKHGTISASKCYDFYEATRGGRPVSQVHLGMDGWTLDTTRTTIDVLGRTKAVQDGRLSDESGRDAVINTRPSVWQMEMGDLMPPWWYLMKDKGIPLPHGASRYPELVEAYRPETEESSTPSNPSSQRSASRGGRKRRTSKPTES